MDKDFIEEKDTLVEEKDKEVEEKDKEVENKEDANAGNNEVLNSDSHEETISEDTDKISYDDVTVHFIKMFGVNPNQAIASISVSKQNNGEPFGYFVALDKEDDDSAPINQIILRKIKEENIIIVPSDTDPTEYYTNEIKNQRDKLLKESAVYLAEDAPITKEEREELLNYRKSLWSVIDNNKKSLANTAWPEKPKWLDRK